MILSLLWKESNEHFRKLLALSILFAIFSIPFIYWEHLSSEFHDIIMGFFLPTCWLIPIWMAAFTVTSEKSARTDRLLSAMPLRPWKIFLVKSTTALLTMLLPMAVLFVYISSKEGGLPPPSEWLGMLIGITSLYLMLVALTARRQRESTVAITGVLAALLLLFWIAISSFAPSESLRWCIIALNPYAPLLSQSFDAWGSNIRNYDLYYIQLVMILFWWTIALLRYNTPPQITPSSSGADAPVGLTPAPLPYKKLPQPRSIFHTLLWREFREQGWIVLAAALAGFLFAGIISTLSALQPRYSAIPKLIYAAHDFAQGTLSLSLFLPAIVAIILGVSSWATDLHAKLFDFWRSRPIPPAAIFWSKFLASLLGILALMTSFALTSLLCETYARSHGYSFNPQTDVPLTSYLYFTAPLALTAILAVSILITLLIRRSLYASITALTLVLIAFTAASKLNEPATDFFLHQTQTALLLITLLTLTLSHRALTHNWQLKPTTH